MPSQYRYDCLLTIDARSLPKHWRFSLFFCLHSFDTRQMLYDGYAKHRYVRSELGRSVDPGDLPDTKGTAERPAVPFVSSSLEKSASRP
jgi:hypothetical protein